jgi:nucleosome assembly protein 1-like 1|eukprot:TRINITY_DN112_c0_g3_i1.p1 TRINITY_DN112_c0_g3~~TRINITY_DN112_c0_g3_i1.p1  ORF type:complete len:337 (+),score=106.74 TRINITY_DN112_c0_g3_i1:96-1106(+)
MGRKDVAPTNEQEKAEDSPLIKELKGWEDKYLELEKEYAAEVHKLQLAFEAKQKPLLEERAKRLAVKEDNSGDAGTPAIPGFWTEALKNHPAFEDEIQEWDEPVLAYLKDITFEQLSAEKSYKEGYKVHFHFETNPYFEPELLTKTYQLEEVCPFRGEDTLKEITSTEVSWKPGKDVTIEKVQKKVKGGGAKKNKQKGKEKEEPRDSFFRKFFRNLKGGDPLPEDLRQLVLHCDDDDEESDDIDVELMEQFMENDRDISDALKDQIVPFAVRWYTGEAAPEDEDDDEESEEDEDESSSEEDDPPPKKGGKAKKPIKGKESPSTGPADAPKEECKQQ